MSRQWPSTVMACRTLMHGVPHVWQSLHVITRDNTYKDSATDSVVFEAAAKFKLTGGVMLNTGGYRNCLAVVRSIMWYSEKFHLWPNVTKFWNAYRFFRKSEKSAFSAAFASLAHLSHTFRTPFAPFRTLSRKFFVKFCQKHYLLNCCWAKPLIF